MELVDTHCHIQSSDKQTGQAGEAGTRSRWEKVGFPSGDDIVDRAAQAGVTRLLCVGCDVADSQLAVDFVQSRTQCWASIGIHPHEAGNYVQAGELDMTQLDAFAALATTPKVRAVGECGLDYYYEHSSPADQATILRYQLELANKHDLPMIFHVREAFDDFWPIFDDHVSHFGAIRGVMHSFTDNQANLDKGLERGLYVGINGIVTFTKSQEQRDMYKNIPLSRILLETDSPFLTPSPYRGNICEPYHIGVIAEFLAELRNEPLQQLAEVTTKSARQLFNL